MKTSKTKLLICIVFLISIMISSSSAYVPIEMYNGVKLKFYIEADRQKCYNIIDSIPFEHFEGLPYIKIKGESIRYLAWYNWGSGIDMYDGCSLFGMIHELAHFCQYNKGDYLWEIIYHKGRFEECEDKIWKSLEN